MSDLIKRDEAIETAVSAAVDWHRYANPYYSLAACIGDAMMKIPPAELKMSDLISREEVVKGIKLSCLGKSDVLIARDAILRYIERIPSAPSWIPVAERLPEVGEWVIVCDTTGDVDMNIKNDSGEFFKEWGSKKEIVAWMPLPEPYKEGNNEQGSV